MLEIIATVILALGLIILIASVVILVPFLRREFKADTETIRATRLEGRRTDLEI